MQIQYKYITNCYSFLPPYLILWACFYVSFWVLCPLENTFTSSHKAAIVQIEPSTPLHQNSNSSRETETAHRPLLAGAGRQAARVSADSAPASRRQDQWRCPRQQVPAKIWQKWHYSHSHTEKFTLKSKVSKYSLFTAACKTFFFSISHGFTELSNHNSTRIFLKVSNKCIFKTHTYKFNFCQLTTV